MNNKYVFFAILVVVGVALDQWTKHIAVAELASRSCPRALADAVGEDLGCRPHPMSAQALECGGPTCRWDHRLVRTVEGEDTTVGDWLLGEFNQVESASGDRLIFGVYRVDASGTPVGPLGDDATLRAGDTVQVGHRETRIIEGFWNHVYVQNYGAAWGFLSNQDERFVRPFFLIVAILAMGIVLNMFRTVTREDQPLLYWALPLIVSGAVGNFIDRARLGYVVDFVDWFITTGGNEKHWPTFNIADVWITIGVALMVLEIVFGKPPAEPEKDATAEDAAEAADASAAA